MFKYVPLNKQIRSLQKENMSIKKSNEANESNIVYVAMMADIDIPEAEAEEVPDVSED